MINAIQEAGKKDRDNSLDSVKLGAIGRINKLMNEKGVKTEELESENRNYNEEIGRINDSDMDKYIKKVIDIEERVSEDVRLKGRKHNKKGGRSNAQEQGGSKDSAVSSNLG